MSLSETPALRLHSLYQPGAHPSVFDEQTYFSYKRLVSEIHFAQVMTMPPHHEEILEHRQSPENRETVVEKDIPLGPLGIYSIIYYIKKNNILHHVINLG